MVDDWEKYAREVITLLHEHDIFYNAWWSYHLYNEQGGASALAAALKLAYENDHGAAENEKKKR